MNIKKILCLINVIVLLKQIFSTKVSSFKIVFLKIIKNLLNRNPNFQFHPDYGFCNFPNISNYVHSKPSLWENKVFQFVYEKQFLSLKPNFFPTHNDFLICTRDHDRDFWITAVLKLRVQSGVYWQISPGGGVTFYLFTCRKKLPNTYMWSTK